MHSKWSYDEQTVVSMNKLTFTSWRPRVWHTLWSVSMQVSHHTLKVTETCALLLSVFCLAHGIWKRLLPGDLHAWIGIKSWNAQEICSAWKQFHKTSNDCKQQPKFLVLIETFMRPVSIQFCGKDSLCWKTWFPTIPYQWSWHLIPMLPRKR